MYGLAVHPAPPLFKSLTKATVGVASQLSASSFTTVISGTGTSAMHCTFTGAGLDAVGSTDSVTETVKLHTSVFPPASFAVHVTVVIPILKATLFNVCPVPVVAPVKVYFTVGFPQSSVA